MLDKSFSITYDGRTFYSIEDANEQLKRYEREDNRFPLLVLGRKSPLEALEEALCKSNISLDNLDLLKSLLLTIFNE